jgi:CBS domain containing-hemolysin-like protein
VLENSALVILALVLVLLNGFFVASEFAIVKLRATRVQELQKLHGLRGGVLAAIHEKLDAYLSACQLGITLASLGLGWIGEPAFARLLEGVAHSFGLDPDPDALHAVSFVVAFTLISFLHIVIGELAPKSMAIRKTEAVSLWTSIPLYAFYWAMYPFIYVLNASANVVLRMMGLGGLDAHSHEAPYSREELRSILHLSRPASGAGRDLRSLVSHALELPDLHVSDVMRPMRELVAIRVGTPADEFRRLLSRNRFSRYPVMNEASEILGILHIKDIYLEEAGPFFFTRLMRWLHAPLLVREDSSVQSLLRQFQQGGSHFAVVQDGQGQNTGFLTFEDVLETIFGEITDEHEPLRKNQIRREPQWDPEGRLVARGDTPLFRIERLLGRAIEGSEDVTTVSGLLMRTLDRVPHPGDAIDHDGLHFEVLKARGPRIERVRVSVPPAPKRD